jgi:hypothetical protein
MTQELHGRYRSYDPRPPMASTLLPTLHFLVVRLRSRARFVPLSKRGRPFEGRPPRLSRSSLSIDNCCHIVKRQNGECTVCRAHLGGFGCHWTLTMQNGEQTYSKLASDFTISEHAGWGIIRSVQSICHCGDRHQMTSKFGTNLKACCSLKTKYQSMHCCNHLKH